MYVCVRVCVVSVCARAFACVRVLFDDFAGAGGLDLAGELLNRVSTLFCCANIKRLLHITNSRVLTVKFRRCAKGIELHDRCVLLFG